MGTFKRLLIATFAPAAQRRAVVEGNPHAPMGGSRISVRIPSGKRKRIRATWRLSTPH